MGEAEREAYAWEGGADRCLDTAVGVCVEEGEEGGVVTHTLCRGRGRRDSVSSEMAWREQGGGMGNEVAWASR